MPRKAVDMAYIAMRCMQHDTVVALAFRKALGITVAAWDPGDARASRAKVPLGGGEEAYAGMAECFENRRAVLL